MRDFLAEFEALKQNHNGVALLPVAERKAKLKRLHDVLLARRGAIRSALHEDFRKHASEVDLTEIYPVVSEIRHVLRHLATWTAPHKVGTPLALTGSRSFVHYEPKGVCLILSPWNFPVNLSLGPLVSAVAAGNCALVKPSEHTPRASEIIRELVAEVFPANEVLVVTGGADCAQALLRLPFQHIFFTGAPEIGKVVMKAAAEHLASVTLELGGKSPSIVDETADVEIAARRMAWAKCVNNGQICIAPDYAFVHETRHDEFVEALRRNLRKFYGGDAQYSRSYARIVNDRHFGRLAGYLDDARARGARLAEGGATARDDRFVAPTLLLDVQPEAQVMQEEIFGPLLPIYRFRALQEPVEFIAARDKPLALYLYSRNQRNIEYVLQNTRAGGTCINHNAVHFFNHNLPFGGCNTSGIGKAHGFAGFQAFSNERAVYRQVLPFSPIELMMPPYNWFKQKLVDFTVRWL